MKKGTQLMDILCKKKVAHMRNMSFLPSPKSHK